MGQGSVVKDGAAAGPCQLSLHAAMFSLLVSANPHISALVFSGSCGVLVDRLARPSQHANEDSLECKYTDCKVSR